MASSTLGSNMPSSAPPTRSRPPAAPASAPAPTITAPQLNQKPLYRVMSEAEVKAVRETGQLRGGRTGETFFTDSNFRSASNAQNRLSLPQKPSHIMEFDIVNNPRIAGGNAVRPDFGMSGGGREYFSHDPIQVRVRSIQPMGK